MAHDFLLSIIKNRRHNNTNLDWNCIAVQRYRTANSSLRVPDFTSTISQPPRNIRMKYIAEITKILTGSMYQHNKRKGPISERKIRKIVIFTHTKIFLLCKPRLPSLARGTSTCTSAQPFVWWWVY